MPRGYRKKGTKKPEKYGIIFDSVDEQYFYDWLLDAKKGDPIVPGLYKEVFLAFIDYGKLFLLIPHERGHIAEGVVQPRDGIRGCGGKKQRAEENEGQQAGKQGLLHMNRTLPDKEYS